VKQNKLKELGEKMKLELQKTHLILINLIIVVSLFFSCINPQPNQQKKTELSVLPEIDSKYNRPCWVKTKPENCEDIQKIPGYWIFFVDKIFTQKFSKETLTEKQIHELQTLLNAQYISALKSKIVSEIKYYDVCLNEKTKDQCNTLYKDKVKLISEGSIKANEIEICDYYWEETKNPAEWLLFGLGKIDKNRYSNKLNLILKEEDNETEQRPYQQEELETKSVYSMPTPSEITSLFDIPATKKFNGPEDQATCKDIKIEFSNLPQKVSLDNCISSIQNSLKTIYSQRKDGYFIDERVLETNSECKKRKQDCMNDHDYEVVEDEIEREFSRIVNCWQNHINVLDTDYINKRKDALIQYKKAHHDVSRFNHLLSEWSYQIDVQIKNNEQKELIEQIHQQKKQLLNSMYLVFTVAYSEDRPTNLGVIRKHSIKLAKNEIFKKENRYNILKHILLEEGNERMEKVHANYNIRITPDHFDSINILPRKFSAKIMKFKVGISANTTEMIDEKDKSILQSLKAKSYIIAGNEDIVFNNLDPVDQDQLKYNTYQKWKELAAQNNIKIRNEQRNTIQDLINNVINANIKAQKQARYNLIEYQNDKRTIDQEINNNFNKIQEINNDLSFMLHSMNVLPKTVKDKKHKDSIISNVKKQYLSYLEQVAFQKELDYDNLNNVQPKIVQLLVDSSYDEEFLMTHATEKIASVFKDNQDEFCSGALIGSIKIHNHKTIQDESLVEKLDPVLVRYRIPVIKIKPEEDNVQAQFSFPIMLQVRCESVQRKFKYNEKDHVIIDSTTNINWKVQTGRYPMKRTNDNEDWQYPRLSIANEIDQYLQDYHKFCTEYSSFYQRVSNKYYYQKYPPISCIERFSVDKNNENWIIKDMLRQEEWKLIENINYSDLSARVRNSNWQINTVESLELFFNELKSSFKQEKENTDIINMLSNKYFWTSSDVSTRAKSTIMLDFKTEKIAEMPEKKEHLRVGIVTRKIRGF